MGYIGKVPTAVPITTSDLADGIVTTSKLANDSVDNTKLDLTDNYAFTGTISGTGDVRLLSTVTLGNQGTADFTSGIGSDYDVYMWHFSDIDTASNCNLLLRYSIDSGSSYVSSSGSYEAAVRGYRSNNEFGTAPTTSDTKMQLTFGGAVIDDSNDHNFSGCIHMASHNNSSTRCHFWWNFGYVSGDSGYATAIYGAGSIRTVAHNPNAIRFLPDSGNFSSGKIKMYGWK